MTRYLVLNYEEKKLSWEAVEERATEPPCTLTIDCSAMTKAQVLEALDAFRDWALASLILDTSESSDRPGS
jgi:hypothetical protein